MSQMVFIEAINQAIAEEMRRDESVYIMGEDIRRAVYGATADLLGEFGEKRVLDTPLSENGFFGAAIGSSLVGMRLHVGWHGSADLSGRKDAIYVRWAGNVARGFQGDDVLRRWIGGSSLGPFVPDVHEHAWDQDCCAV
jgi:hypothetical protein